MGLGGGGGRQNEAWPVLRSDLAQGLNGCFCETIGSSSSLRMEIGYITTVVMASTLLHQPGLTATAGFWGCWKLTRWPLNWCRLVLRGHYWRVEDGTTRGPTTGCWLQSPST